MNAKPVFNLFSRRGKAQAVVQQGVTTLIISSVALSLVALTACIQVVPANEPVAAVAPPQAKAASGQHNIEALPNIDPADRKFFTPGYGLNAGGNDLTVYHQSEWDRTPNTALGVAENTLAVYHQSEWGRTPNAGLGVEALSKIDPADRKFFNPGYGAQTVMPGEPEVFPNVDPADRKFFSSGYGAQVVMSSESEALPTIDLADRKFFHRSIIFLLK